ncbi:MAG: hypothetical protein JXD18_01750 [Anaerolineae bacterium]|nr:hypothetical protein [Anaerolineae bacterium]
MSVSRKMALRDLVSAAYELDASVLHGEMKRAAESGAWAVDNTTLDEWLARFEGQQVYVIVASPEDERPLPSKVCRTCGTEYTGAECPRCLNVRQRLRGR